MPKRTNLAIAPLLALALGSVGALLAPAASAASPFTDSHFDPGRSVNANNCTTVYDPVTDPADVPVATDGADHSYTQSFTATVTSNTDPTDITTVAASQRVVGKVGAQGSDPSMIWMSYSGKLTSTPNKASSLCTLSEYSEIYTELEFSFTLTKPMWVNLNLSSPDASSYSEVELWKNEPTGGSPYVDMYNYKLKFAATGRAYLPAGSYSGYLEGDTYAKPVGTSTSTGSLTATFTTPGSKSAGPSGKAKPYIALGASRNCTSHTLATKVTTNKKRAKTIKKIVIRVNGHKVKTVKSHFRGRAIPLTLADTKAANVKATVTTVQKKKHHKKIRKNRTVSANYLACS